MIYVYDIILNWTDNDKVYEFFEWEINDELEHIKRMPLFKISSSNFDKIYNYDFKIDKDFLNNIYKLTETFSQNNIEKLLYGCLFTDGIRALAVEFDEEGNSIYRSKLLLDEEQDVTILSNKLHEYKLDILLNRKREYDDFTTRLESDIKKILQVEIKDSYKNGNFDKLKYLYFECFGKEKDDVNIIYKKLLESLEKEVNYGHNKLYEVIKLSYQNKG